MLTMALQVSSSPINCLALNQLGSRMFTGDAEGVLMELSIDVSPLTACNSQAAAAWAAAAAAEATAGSAGTASAGGPSDGGGQLCQAAGSHLSSLRPSTPTAVAAAAAAAATAEAVSPVAAVLRYGGTASQLVTGGLEELHCLLWRLGRNVAVTRTPQYSKPQLGQQR